MSVLPEYTKAELQAMTLVKIKELFSENHLKREGLKHKDELIALYLDKVKQSKSAKPNKKLHEQLRPEEIKDIVVTKKLPRDLVPQLSKYYYNTVDLFSIIHEKSEGDSDTMITYWICEKYLIESYDNGIANDFRSAWITGDLVVDLGPLKKGEYVQFQIAGNHVDIKQFDEEEADWRDRGSFNVVLTGVKLDNIDIITR